LTLENEQKGMIYKLKRGEWIVRTPNHPDPFMVVTPDYPVDWNIDEKLIEDRLRSNFPELFEIQPVAAEPKSDLYSFPSSNAKALLIHRARYPLKSLSRCYMELNLGIHGVAIKEELVRKGFVGETEIPFGDNRPTKFLVPTDRGLEFLKKIGEDTRKWQFWGNQDFPHRVCQMIAYFSYVNSGHQAKREENLPSGKRVDVFVSVNSQRVGIEIEMDSNINVWGLLKAQKDLDELIIVCRDLQVLRRIDSKLQQVAYPAVIDKIKLFTISQYMKTHRNVLFEDLENYPSNESKHNSED
jgi:hypothetical protein